MPRNEGSVLSPRTGIALVESTDVAAALIDGDGRFTQWNSAFELLTGYRKESTPPTWSEFILRESPTETRNRAEIAVSTRTVFAGELICRRVPDSPLWCDVTLVPVPSGFAGDGGDSTVMMALLRETTTRRVAEQALGGAEVADRFVLDRIQLGIVVHAADSRILYANNKAAELLGITFDRLLGRGKVDPAWQFFDADSQPLPVEAFPVSRVMATGEALHGQIVGVRRPTDGRTLWALCQAFPIKNADGNLTEIVVSFTDVTPLMEAERERARSEERLQLIFNATNDALWDVDLQTGEGWCSPHYWEMFGYTERRSHVTTDEMAALIHPDDRERTLSRMSSHLASDTRTYELEVRMKHRSGRDVHVLVHGIILRDDQGNAVRVAGTTTDITARRGMEQRLRQSQKLESVGHLAGGVAHDFNNLLAIISGNLELLEEGGAQADDTGALIREARSAALRGAGLTKRLLAFSRQQPLRLELVNPVPVVTNATELMRRVLPESIDVSGVCPETLPAIHADTGLLENALLNLVINARDAMNGRGTLTISAALVRLAEVEPALVDVEPGDYVRVSVTDTGCGMSKEIAEQAIEPFFTTKEVGQGTGLGLSMVYGFVRQCGGGMHIRSAEGRGTTVSLYFPAQTPRSDALTPPYTPAVVTPTHSRRIRRDEVVLVVEDDPSVRMLCLRELAALGFRTLEANDGPSALAIFDAAPRVDLLLTDIVMPGGMNGNEVAAALTMRDPNLQVVFMSGYHADILKDLVRDVNTHLLSKPFSITELSVLLDELLPPVRTDGA